MHERLYTRLPKDGTSKDANETIECETLNTIAAAAERNDAANEYVRSVNRGMQR